MTSTWHTAFRTLQEEPGGPTPGLALRAGATALACLYGLGARARRRLYDRGWRQPQRLPAPVLSLGNLVVGGVGKTPLTAWLAQRFQAAGCRVVILSRGYGGLAPGINVVSDGRRIFLQPPQAGDEAYLLAQKLPGIPVITGVDRYQAGLQAWEAFRPDLFLLDDGFQHFQLHRDLDVVLLDAARPFGNGRLLPRGPLREPVSTLHRPLVLVLTRYEAEHHQSTWEAVQAAFPAAVVLRAAFELSHAVKYPGSQKVSLAALAPMSLAGLAGLARPEVFADSLRQAGVDLKHFFSFPDHHAFAPAELAGLVAAARRLGAQGLITTEKDWMRLAGKWHADLPLYVVHLHVNLLDPWPLHLLPPGCAQKLRTP
jgi:tetraacyldisaccharide 4'-kinase